MMKTTFLPHNCVTFLLAIIFLIACDTEKECISIEKSFALDVIVNKTGQVGEEIPLTISFPCYNSCGSFYSFSERMNGNEITIDILAKYEGCTCLEYPPIRTVDYIFMPTHTGEFYFRFPQLYGGDLVDTLVID